MDSGVRWVLALDRRLFSRADHVLVLFWGVVVLESALDARGVVS